MRAARVHEFGNPLQIDDVPSPAAEGDEVVVQLTHAGVNPIDIRVAEGGAGRVPLPFILGCEGTGTVDGAPVLVYGGGIGLARSGTYAERVVAPTANVIAVPDGIDPVQAAGLGLAGVTAWGVVHADARIATEDRVLVLGSSGGVGTLAVQLAVAAGATVHAQTSTSKDARLLRDLGADEVVATEAEGLRDAFRDFKPTVVIDPLGGPFTSEALRCVASEARIIVFGVAAGQRSDIDLALLYRKAASLRGHAALTTPVDDVRRALGSCLELMAAGQLRVHVDEVLPLGDVNDVHTRLLERRATGKLLLSVTD